MYSVRSATERLRRLTAAFPVVVVSGARQVGKTTLLRHAFPGHDYVVFDPGLDVQNARAEPDLFLRNHPPPLVLDEIQYAPELVAAVKRHVDEQGARAGMYLLTGSQQWQVMRTLAESLAGRATFLDLYGFSLQEIAGLGDAPGWLGRWLANADDLVSATPRTQAPFDGTLWEWLWRGSMPGAVPLPQDLIPDFWTGYHRTYIERDARLAGEVDDWQRFGMFLRLASALTAQEVNASQLGRDIGITPQTARRWLAILVGTFQWFEHPALARNPVKRVSSKPKGYLADTGLACFHAHLSTPKALGGHPLAGALFETAMVNEVRKQAAALTGATSFHHWRAAGGAEVDLILERDGQLFPFEIKMTANPTRRDASGLLAFRKAHPSEHVAKGAILCAVDRPFWLNEDTAALPWNLL
jgi:predicted AAA+ superfamily ATPase